MDAQALGRYLRESREAKELTLDDAERVLRIRRRILESFELGEFNFSDASSVQIRGFIRNYARYLGLDAEYVVRYYDAARVEGSFTVRRDSKRSNRSPKSAVPRAARSITDTNPSLPAIPLEMRTPRPARARQMLNILVLLLVAGAALAVIVFVTFQLLNPQEPAIDMTALNVNILQAATATASLTRRPTLTSQPSLTPIPRVQQNYSGQGVLVTIEMSQRTWIRMAADGVDQFVGIATPGMILEYEGQNTVLVTASNAEALIVTYNGRPQGLFGGRGQKVDIVFGLNGQIEVSSGPGFEPTSEFGPTPLPTSAVDVGALVAALTPTRTPGPSPTVTYTPSITLTPSDTPTLTRTPTPTLTPSNTPTNTLTPTATRTPTTTPTLTNTPTPTATLTPAPTAVLPPRATQEGLPPTKPPGSDDGGL
jgi:cytoskeletal protein RodZ